MLTVVRLTTIHPILVHFTIGALPIVFLAYAVGAVKRSERWTFVGDVGVIVTAIITLATVAFGLVSNWTLDWPGSLMTYRWLHLGLGAGATVLLCALAVSRLVHRRRAETIAQPGTVLATAVIGVAVLATGWIGGEVLVYRSGMAVVAAGDGALAQPTTSRQAQPRDIPEAMDAVQAAWGSANAAVAGMLVRKPEARAFSDVEGDAKQLEHVADWMSSEGKKHVKGDVDGFADAAGALRAHASELESAAHDSDIRRTTEALGAVATTCASCHSVARWNQSAGPQASR